jgi:ribosomal protein L37AE/L43A
VSQIKMGVNMNPFSEYRFCCPSCGSSHFHKRKGFHLIAKYRCHKCKCTFFKPRKMKQFTQQAQITQNIKSTKKSTIKHGKTWF